MRAAVAELASGLRVATLPSPHLARAAITFATRVGARYERGASAGLSHFLEHMLHRGTPRHPTAHALASAIESMGGTLDAATGVDTGTFTLSVPPEHVLGAIDLLGEIITTPLFSAIEVERGIVREELLEDRDERGRLVDPDSLARAQIFGLHPLGQPIAGTLSTLLRFNHARLVSHHRQHYTALGSALAVTGRLPSPASILRRSERAFASLPRRARVGAAPPFRSKKRVGPPLSIVRSSSSQVSLRLSALAPARRTKAEAAAELLLRVIDDGNSTRLYAALCDRLGLCYDVSAGYEPYRDCGFFDLAAEAAEHSVTQVAAELFDLVRDLALVGPSESEVAKAKRRATWQDRRFADQPETLAEQVALSLLSGEAVGAMTRSRKLRDVTARDVQRVAAQVFHPSRVALTAVGPVRPSTARMLSSMLARYARGWPRA